MRTARRLADLALAAVLLAGAARRAHADPRIEKADELFAEGKALLSSNLLEACVKFGESLRYNPAAIGTLFNVALCDERFGRIASAVAKFVEVRDRAKEQALDQHLRAAEEHLAALKPRVPHLSLQLTETLPETTLLVDDRVVPADARDDVPIDPGEHVIVVSAPNRLPYRLQLAIAKGEHRTLVIPALARSVTITSSRRRIGQITTASGAAVFGVGVGLGVYAYHQYHKQLDKQLDNGICRERSDGLICDAITKSAIDNARNWGTTGTIVGAAGIAIATAGIFLWINAPRSTPGEPADKKLAIVPELTGDGLGVAALGRF